MAEGRRRDPGGPAFPSLSSPNSVSSFNSFQLVPETPRVQSFLGSNLKGIDGHLVHG